MDRSNLEAYQQRFEKVVSERITDEMMTPVVNVDSVVEFDAITSKFINVHKQMAPYGPGNQNPVFEARNVYVFNALSNFKDRHVKFIVAQEKNDRVFQAIGFDMAEHYERLSNRDLCNMTFSIEENTYHGNTTIQLKIKDIKFN
jgi:single-stranded-DNA-specific exonuclease